LQLRERAASLLRSVMSETGALEEWLKALPKTETLASDLQGAYREHADVIAAEAAGRLAVLAAVASVLQEKVDDPSATPSPPDLSLLNGSISTTVVAQAAVEHNSQVVRHAEVAEERVTTILDHLIGSRSSTFRELQGELESAKATRESSKKASGLAQRALLELQQKKFSSSAMAETLTQDLARVYGKNHLSVSVTQDGKSYSCRRGSEPATHLSEGERTTLSLLYFLRKLEDESAGGDPEQRVVVVDDPSSSLDREAVFATHQWLVDTLKNIGQVIVLTHDFHLLRLFVRSQSSAWGKSLGELTRGNQDEQNFPRVAFLEMYAATSDEVRCSKLDALPSMLRKSTTEYAYLFSMVMNAVGNPEDERLFLLPNATRRVLEVFASYRAPHLGNFDQQLEMLIADSGTDDPYRDVYNFCHKYSHGEGHETIDVLDARAVHGQIRRCMEFLRAVDPDHFSRMCKATGADETALG